MSGLVEKLEAAEVGSRELDVLVAMALEPTTAQPGGGWLWYTATGHIESINPRPSTTSLDAALALAERVLPGWTWEITIDGCGSVQGAPEMWPEGLAAPDRDGVSADARTPALALCIAILRALNLNETRHAE